MADNLPDLIAELRERGLEPEAVIGPLGEPSLFVRKMRLNKRWALQDAYPLTISGGTHTETHPLRQWIKIRGSTLADLKAALH
jgi:hypothetical protein